MRLLTDYQLETLRAWVRWNLKIDAPLRMTDSYTFVADADKPTGVYVTDELRPLGTHWFDAFVESYHVRAEVRRLDKMTTQGFVASCALAIRYKLNAAAGLGSNGVNQTLFMTDSGRWVTAQEAAEF